MEKPQIEGMPGEEGDTSDDLQKVTAEDANVEFMDDDTAEDDDTVDNRETDNTDTTHAQDQ